MITFSVEKITPKKATEYLKSNIDNYRKMKRSIVMGYVEDMKNGKWELNGEAICFGEDGKLKNGQHRLCAIALSGKTIEMVVARGIANNVTMYDIGHTRTTEQIASASGIQCNATITAAANILANRFTTRAKGRSNNLEYLQKHVDELNRAYRVVYYGNGSYSKNAPSLAAAYLVLYTKKVPLYETELFFRMLNDPYTNQAEMRDISSINIARKMLDDRAAKKGGGYQLQKERLEILCLALRDFHEEKHCDECYKLSEPFYYISLMDEADAMDKKEER